MNKKIIFTIAFVLIVAVLAIIFLPSAQNDLTKKEDGFYRFKSIDQIYDAFQNQNENYVMIAQSSRDMMQTTGVAPTDSLKNTESTSYSETNVQVKGVDEADIIKTDGEYIYLIKNKYINYSANSELIIVKKDEIVLRKNYENFFAQELYIDKGKVILQGTTEVEYNRIYPEMYTDPALQKEVYSTREVVDSGSRDENNTDSAIQRVMPSPYIPRTTVSTIKVINSENLETIKSFDFQGSYITSRKINQNIYLIIDSYPRFYEYGNNIKPTDCIEIAPVYRETTNDENKDFENLVSCDRIGYVMPMDARGFITVIGINLDTLNLEKEVIVGNSQNVYSSKDNLYIAQTTYPRYSDIGEVQKDFSEETVISKFNLDNGKITFQTTGRVKGHVLNQFSMDEHNDYFRIATTKSANRGRIVASPSAIAMNDEINNQNVSENFLFVLDKDLKIVGQIEGISPDERIYSARFLNDKAYLVTFRQVDPLFVIDLKDPENPKILGELKIPGYSSYLHPYSENYLIGIGKEVLENTDPNDSFVFEQGVKISLFDVTDLKNPIELHKEVIGDRGTYTDALNNHKAFFFDKEKNILIIPITLAQYSMPPENNWEYGRYTYQGMYVYNIDVSSGINLLGRITHSEDGPNPQYYYFEEDVVVKRSLYIDNVLYTFSNNRLQLNDFSSLELIKKIDLK